MPKNNMWASYAPGQQRGFLPPGFMEAATAPGRNIAAGIAQAGEGISRGLATLAQNKQNKEKEAKAEAKQFDHAFGLGKSLNLWGDEAKAASTGELMGRLAAAAIQRKVAEVKEQMLQKERQLGQTDQRIDLERTGVMTGLQNDSRRLDQAEQRLGQEDRAFGAEMEFRSRPPQVTNLPGGGRAITKGNHMQVLPDQTKLGEWKPLTVKGREIPDVYVGPVGPDNKVVNLKDKSDPLAEAMAAMMLRSSGMPGRNVNAGATNPQVRDYDRDSGTINW